MNHSMERLEATELNHRQVDYTKYKLSEKEIAHLTQSDRHNRRGSSTECDSVISTSVNDTSITNNGQVVTLPVGLKVISLVSMVTAITLISASGVLLYKSNQTLMAWLKAAPTTLNILSEVSKVFGGTSSIVEEVQSQEKYLRILILCSATLIATGFIQLMCNLWFFFKMNSSCVADCCIKTDQFCCGR